MEKESEKAKTLALLGHQYKGFINSQDNWEFFRGLADYTKTLQEMSATKPLIEIMESQREASQKLIEQMGRVATKELATTVQKMQEITSNLSTDHKPLIKLFEATNKQLAQSANSLRPLHEVNNGLVEVVQKLNHNGFSDAIKQFQEARENATGEYVFSPTYEKLIHEKEKIERRTEVEPWGAWEHLPIAQRLVIEPEVIQAEVRAEAEANSQLKVTALNFFGVAGEMEKIRSGEIDEDSIVYFRVKDFRDYAKRVNHYVTKQLLLNETKDQKLDFNDKKSSLLFAGKNIIISKRAQSDPHDLLRTIFKNKAKDWQTDEVLDDWRFAVDNKAPKNKVYQAGKAVNRIVASKTTIHDFLVVTTKQVKINEKYLGK